MDKVAMGCHDKFVPPKICSPGTNFSKIWTSQNFFCSPLKYLAPPQHCQNVHCILTFMALSKLNLIIDSICIPFTCTYVGVGSMRVQGQTKQRTTHTGGFKSNTIDRFDGDGLHCFILSNR